jgi:RimJ/RimL family protein N-acetyltransferase
MQQHLLKNGRLLVLREAEPRDAENILAYIEQVAGESENLTFGPGEFELTVEQERAFLQMCFDSPTSLYLLAELDGELAGTLSFSAGKRRRIRHTGEFGISVAQAFWGLGIGGYLLAYLIDWARAGEIVRKINLFVRTDNLPAIHLYEKYGFVREGTQTREFYVRGQFIDVHLMGLQIDPPGLG